MRPIDADMLIKDWRICGACKYSEKCDGAIFCSSSGARQAISQAPTIDATPVKHGRWIIHREEIFEPNRSECYMNRPLPTECSVCGFAEMRASRFAFCPYCGAKMDLKDGENNA